MPAITPSTTGWCRTCGRALVLTEAEMLDRAPTDAGPICYPCDQDLARRQVRGERGVGADG